MKFLRYIAAREKECGAVLAVQLIYSAVCLAAFVYNVASGGGASKITASVSYIFLILLPSR